MRGRTIAWILAAVLAIYLLGAIAFALTKSPGNDEGWFAAPAYNLATNGTLGMLALEPNGSWVRADLTGIREHTYWNIPLGMVAHAAWFRLVGFGLFPMRVLSILWGVVVLGAWFFIIRSLTRDVVSALLGVALLSIDYTFLWGASDGRVDMMCLALGSSGMAAYLLLRERDLSAAVLISNTLAAAGLFTHPNGLLAITALGFLMLYYDARQLSKRDLVAALPYILGLVAWGFYIHTAPVQFVAQFGANAAVKSGSRLAIVMHPLSALFAEIVAGYAAHFGLLSVWTDRTTPWNLLIPAIYWTALISMALSHARKHRGNRALVAITAIFFLLMTLNGLKLQFYLVYVMPTYAAVMGVWVRHMLRGRLIVLVPLLVVPLLLLQLNTIVRLAGADRYHKTYLPAMQYLRRNMKPDSVVMANSSAAFALGYNQLVDDERVGYFSSVAPDFLVADRFYPIFWSGFRGEQPEIAQYVVSKRQSQYTPVFRNEYYTIYRRTSVPDRSLIAAKR